MKYCSAPWDTAHINYSSQLSSCFCEVFHKKGDIGNAALQPISVLFNSQSQKEFRSSIVDQSFKYCKADTCVNFYRLDEVDQIDDNLNKIYLPTTLQLQIDPVCNLKCGICRSNNIYYTEARPEAVQILNNIVNEYQNFENKVNFHCDGSGEVFVSRAYLDFFRRNDLPKCFYFNIQTNGNLITKNIDIILKLQNQIEMVVVSLDAATEETYKIVRGGNFSIVLDGIVEMKKLGIKVWTEYIVQTANYHEIPNYVKLCKELGVDKISLQLMGFLGHMTPDWWRTNSVETNPTVDKKFLISLLTELKNDPQVEICGGLEYLLVKANDI
jgi:MoaA/NifB/PqqE/SkfB family radical SAM enzyme